MRGDRLPVQHDRLFNPIHKRRIQLGTAAGFAAASMVARAASRPVARRGRATAAFTGDLRGKVTAGRDGPVAAQQRGVKQVVIVTAQHREVGAPISHRLNHATQMSHRVDGVFDATILLRESARF